METTTKTDLIYGAIILVLIGGFLFWQNNNPNNQVEIDPINNEIEEVEQEEQSGVQERRDPNLVLIENYLDQYISELSPSEAVLGGAFYITEIEHIDDSNLIVSYEDGHIALKAKVEYEIKEDDTVEIKNFEILEE